MYKNFNQESIYFLNLKIVQEIQFRNTYSPVNVNILVEFAYLYQIIAIILSCISAINNWLTVMSTVLFCLKIHSE